jgi:ubiquitin-activating enzyme E1
MMLNGNILDQ